MKAAETKKALPWQQAKELLARLVANPRFGLFSDLDGTLSPIAPTPQAAQITPRNRELLAELSKQLHIVALISGRRVASLQARVNLPGIIYIGNHGLEHWVNGRVEILPEATAYLPAMQAAKPELETLLVEGTYVEDKEATLSLHYRQAARPQEFAKAHADQIAEIVQKHGLALFTGKMVFEVRPPIAVDKGSAFRQLAEQAKLQAALFLGDDISDLHALRVAQELRQERCCQAFGVGVLSAEAPEVLAASADFLASSVEDVEALLDWLLMACKASST